MSLLRAVLQNPSCDETRLVYADWLDDRGEHERAYNIRTGVKDHNGYTLHNRDSPTHRYYTFPRDPMTEWGCSDTLPEYCSSGADNRGFLYDVSLTLESFLKNKKHLFSNHPITKVRLVGKSPYPSVSWRTWAWSESEDHITPPHLGNVIWEALEGYSQEVTLEGWRDYDSETKAYEALSDACVRLGRKEAGL